MTLARRLGCLASAGLAGLLALGGVFLGMAWSSSCAMDVHDPLSVDQLIEVRERFDDYRSHPDQHALVMSGDQIAMLIEDEASIPLHIAFDEDLVSGRAALPAFAGGCWDVGFHGLLTVDDGAAVLVPDRMTVGSLDLSWYFAGRPLRLHPDQMPERLGWFVRNMRHAEVNHNHMEVDLAAPSTFRWK